MTNWNPRGMQAFIEIYRRLKIEKEVKNIKFCLYLVTSLLLLADVDIGGRLVDGVDLGVENVEPARLVGILVGVPSSLTRDMVDPCRDTGRDAGRDVLGVRLDRIGIEVFVVNSVLEGVRRSKVESE
jgi:hypothetical protein